MQNSIAQPWVYFNFVNSSILYSFFGLIFKNWFFHVIFFVIFFWKLSYFLCQICFDFTGSLCPPHKRWTYSASKTIATILRFHKPKVKFSLTFVLLYQSYRFSILFWDLECSKFLMSEVSKVTENLNHSQIWN